MNNQGAEYQIIKTASTEIFQRVDKWLIECHSTEKSENQELEKIFKNNNYRIEWLGNEGINSDTPHLFAEKIH